MVCSLIKYTIVYFVLCTTSAPVRQPGLQYRSARPANDGRGREQDEAVLEVVEAARGKFRKAVALLGGAERLGLPRDTAAAAAAAAASSGAAVRGTRLEAEDAALLF